MNQKTRKKNPSLLDREATGGFHSESGSVFQANVVVGAVCRWLADEGFSALIRESLGDVEANFFVPGMGFQKEFIEAKTHPVEVSEFWNEINRFIELDTCHPGIYRSFTLASPDIHKSLKPIVNGLDRVRNPVEFYGRSSSVISLSYEDFEKLVKKQKRSEKEAQFIFEKVSVSLDLGGQSHGNILYEHLKNYLPEYHKLSIAEVNAIYISLRDFLHVRKNQPYSRIEIETIFKENIEPQHQPPPKPINFNIGSEQLTVLQFQWDEFSGETVPSSARWNEKVIGELEQTRSWILANRTERRIKVNGMYRLPTALAIGAVYSATSGFSLDVTHRESIFSTADGVATDGVPSPYQWQVTQVDGTAEAGRLIVTIGVVSRLAGDVETYVRQNTAQPGPILHLYNSAPLLSAQQASSAVASAKQLIKENLAGTTSNQIDLFLATPSWFATFFGYRSSSLPPIQTYQFVPTNRNYFPAVFISAR